MKNKLFILCLAFIYTSYAFSQEKPISWSWDYSKSNDSFLDLQVSCSGFIETNSPNIYAGELLVTLPEGVEFNEKKAPYFTFDGNIESAAFNVKIGGRVAIISLNNKSLPSNDNEAITIALNPKTLKGNIDKNSNFTHTIEFHKQSVSTTFTSPVTGRTYSLVFNDEFNDQVIDSLKWDTRSNRSPFTRRGMYEDKPYYVLCHDDWTKELDGELRLEVSKYPTQQNVIMTGGILTQDRFMTKYGYYETKASFRDCVGEAYWPAFWLNFAEEDKYTTGTEIDIFEYIPRDKQIFHTIHWFEKELQDKNENEVQHAALNYDKSKEFNEHRSSTKYFTLENAETDYHTIGLEWTPEELIFHINGKVTRRVSRTEGLRNIPTAYLMVYFSCSAGEWGGNAMRNNKPAYVYFDYCRCYQEPEQDAIYTIDGEERKIKASERMELL